MPPFRLERNVHHSGSRSESERNAALHWRNASVQQRAAAASYLISVAFGHPPDQPPAFDRTAFQTRKR